MLTIVLVVLVEYEGWGYRQNWKKNFKQRLRILTTFFSEDIAYRYAFWANYIEIVY